MTEEEQVTEIWKYNKETGVATDLIAIFVNGYPKRIFGNYVAEVRFVPSIVLKNQGLLDSQAEASPKTTGGRPVRDTDLIGLDKQGNCNCACHNFQTSTYPPHCDGCGKNHIYGEHCDPNCPQAKHEHLPT